jgi:hypothetical protein
MTTRGSAPPLLIRNVRVYDHGGDIEDPPIRDARSKAPSWDFWLYSDHGVHAAIASSPIARLHMPTSSVVAG